MKHFQSRSGFTIFELLIFSAALAILMMASVAVLVSVTRVHVRQTAAADVSEQSQFLLQAIQYYVERSSVIDLATDATTSTLKLRMAASSTDPTYLYLSAGTVYLKQTDGGTPQPLTSSRITVSDLAFTKRAHMYAHDSVSISFTASYNTQSAIQQFSQSIDTAISRVSAATFDSNLVPSTTATYDVGVTSQVWRSVNNVIYFSGSNVGVGVSNPGQTFEVNGGMRINTTASRPTCSAAQRGTFWVVQNGTGVKDSVSVCVKDEADSYSWATIY